METFVKSVVLLYQLTAVGLAGVALYSIRHEVSEKATMRLAWVATPALAIAAAAALLIVSPVQRIEFWILAVAVGFFLGALAGSWLKINQDVGQQLLRVARTWDGAIAAVLLLLLALARLVISPKPGELGLGAGIAAFLAAYLTGRYIIARFYKAPRAIHLDMIRGRNPRRTLIV